MGPKKQMPPKGWAARTGLILFGLLLACVLLELALNLATLFVQSRPISIGEERGTIEDVLEPFLIQQGYLMRTPRGRVATARAYQHFGLPVGNSLNDGGESPLFDGAEDGVNPDQKT